MIWLFVKFLNYLLSGGDVDLTQLENSLKKRSISAKMGTEADDGVVVRHGRCLNLARRMFERGMEPRVRTSRVFIRGMT